MYPCYQPFDLLSPEVFKTWYFARSGVRSIMSSFIQIYRWWLLMISTNFEQNHFSKWKDYPPNPAWRTETFLSCVYKKSCNTSGKLTWEWKQKTVWRCISYEKLGDFPANHVSFRVGNSSKLCFSTTYVIPKDFRSQPKSWRVNKPFKSTA